MTREQRDAQNAAIPQAAGIPPMVWDDGIAAAPGGYPCWFFAEHPGMVEVLPSGYLDDAPGFQVSDGFAMKGPYDTFVEAHKVAYIWLLIKSA